MRGTRRERGSRKVPPPILCKASWSAHPASVGSWGKASRPTSCSGLRARTPPSLIRDLWSSDATRVRAAPGSRDSRRRRSWHRDTTSWTLGSRRRPPSSSRSGTTEPPGASRSRRVTIPPLGTLSSCSARGVRSSRRRNPRKWRAAREWEEWRGPRTRTWDRSETIRTRSRGIATRSLRSRASIGPGFAPAAFASWWTRRTAPDGKRPRRSSKRWAAKWTGSSASRRADFRGWRSRSQRTSARSANGCARREPRSDWRTIPMPTGSRSSTSEASRSGKSVPFKSRWIGRSRSIPDRWR